MLELRRIPVQPGCGMEAGAVLVQLELRLDGQGKKIGARAAAVRDQRL